MKKMKKKVLIIGGTYFAGRVFAILAAREGHELTFINRGRYSMKSLGGNIREFQADRKDEKSLKGLLWENANGEEEFDAIADFCAYEPGDILRILDNLPVRFHKYIFFSTADVYKRSEDIKTEKSERISQMPSDEGGIYAYKKKLLEDELISAAGERGFSFTILRPAFIYGPYNYAPRESVYIRSLIKHEPIFQPIDSDGQFQMVYVKDAANAVLSCIENPASDNKAYNLSAPDVMDYSAFLELMEKASGIHPENVQPVTVREVLEQNIPLPFPLTKEESELFDGSCISDELGLVYTDIREGMKNTFQAFRPVFE